VQALQQWASSLPWVHVRTPCDERELVRFAIDCPPLGCDRVWLLIDAPFSPALPPTILVVLPGAVAHRGVATGWAVAITELGDDRQVVAVGTPSTGAEYRALQALLALAYEASFRHAANPGPA
jgi:hypothetical protein